MKSTDLKIIADIFVEMRRRWPAGLSHANLPNICSFLNFRYKQAQIKDSDNFINYFTNKLKWKR